MLHVVLGVYILCFAGGVALVVVSVLASRRLALRRLLDLGLLAAASTLILVVEALKTYERAVGGNFGAGLHVAAICLSALGNTGITWYLVLLPLEITGRPASRPLQAGVGALAILAAALGGVKEAAGAIGTGPGIALGNVDFLALLALQVFAVTVVLVRLGSTEPARLRSILRVLAIFVAAFTPLGVLQFLAQNSPTAPPLLRDFPVGETAYYLVLVVAAIVLLARNFSEPTRSPATDLPADFVRRFGISNREREIIEMMAQGLSNSAIAEKLFISTVTVKNHIYHIYQKTGAGNKVQLLNLMNSLK